MNEIGALRARVQLLSPARTEDDIGGATLSWNHEGWAWAEIAALGGGSAAAFDTLASFTSLRVSIRRRDGIRAGWRLAWGDRVLRVAAVRDDGAPRIELNCEEEVL